MISEHKEQPDNTEERPSAQNVPPSDVETKGKAGTPDSAPEKEIREFKRATDRFVKDDGREEVPVELVVAEGSEFVEKVVAINRITKVTKGGKKLSFSALVVVGDTKGNVGYSLSKAAEVSIAIRKAIAVAKKNMVQIHLHGTTITHEIIGRCGGASVLLKLASDGTGVIAAGPV